MTEQVPNPTCANCGEQKPPYEAGVSGLIRITDYEAERQKAEAEGSDVLHFDSDQMIAKTCTGFYLCRRCSLALTPKQARDLMAQAGKESRP